MAGKFAGGHPLLAISMVILGALLDISSSSFVPFLPKIGSSIGSGSNSFQKLCDRIYWDHWKEKNLTQSPLLNDLLDSEDAKKYMNFLNKSIDLLAEFTGLPKSFLDLPDPDIRRHPLDMIKDTYKYKDATEVRVTTETGYILTMWRIPCRKEKCDPETKHPVLLMHGLMMSGGDWIFNTRESNLPFMLVEAGHTVYLGNARGNVYSRDHVKAKTDKEWNPAVYNSSYWKFGVHEMGHVDLPALISKIRELHNGSQVNYVGYSMGTTEYLIYKSENCTLYDADINKAVLLAPAAFIGNLKSPLILLALAMRLGGGILPYTLVSLQQLLASGQDGPVTDTVAGLTSPLTVITQHLLPILVPQVGQVLAMPSLNMLLVEGSPIVKNKRAMQLALGHQPCGGSLRTINHYLQLYKSGLFQKYRTDPELKKIAQLLGALKGERGEPDPLTGNIPGGFPNPYRQDKDESHILVLYGKDDSLVVPEDALLTAETFTNYHCEIPKFNHLDFQLGNDTEVWKMNSMVLDWFNIGPANWTTARCSMKRELPKTN